jgi:lysophospholipase L1-like esterase
VALNHAVDSAARPFGVEIASGFSEFKLASQRFGVNPCLAGLLTVDPTKPTLSCGVHPSYAGQALLAQALAKAIRF